MKRILFLVAFFLGFLFEFSCTKDNTSPVQSDLFPLNNGNYWVYLDSTYNQGGWWMDTSKISIGSQITILGHAGYMMNSNTTTDNPYHLIYLASNDAKGNFVYVGAYSDLDTLISPTIRFKNNPSKNESWTTNMLYGIYDTGRVGIEDSSAIIKCTALDTMIIAPVGKFTCTVYALSFKNGPNYVDRFIYYVSRNEGIIKTLHYENTTLQRVSYLIRYKIIK